MLHEVLCYTECVHPNDNHELHHYPQFDTVQRRKGLTNSADNAVTGHNPRALCAQGTRHAVKSEGEIQQFTCRNGTRHRKGSLGLEA